ncbi:GNAT family N-acetyltransferase [uncultured Aquitalea sp.]|uniref:GNAT family N-acetyltransferase n=1 Tax=uncultured Aquitalea sp. TaxID=540272 RepID=UPI0025CEF405|nr:GNAT family N-acetyltransferase [uncultured Aquitalea sp.]
MASLLQWQCHDFDGFSPRALYETLQLRDQVFVVEQQSIYGDVDGEDLVCHHLCGRDGAGRLVGYARLIAPGRKYPDAVAIGRVVLAPTARGQGLGGQLLAEALHHCLRLWPEHPVMLSAQVNAQGLYERYGFVAVSEPYDDGGILHIDMRRGGLSVHH